MPGDDSALREKVLGGNDARRKRLQLRCGLRLRPGLCGEDSVTDGDRGGATGVCCAPSAGPKARSTRRPAASAAQTMRRGPRPRSPCGAKWPRQRKTRGFPCPERTNRKIDDRIEHWLRDAHPKRDPHFPLSKDLLMGDRRESYRITLNETHNFRV